MIEPDRAPAIANSGQQQEGGGGQDGHEDAQNTQSDAERTASNEKESGKSLHFNLPPAGEWFMLRKSKPRLKRMSRKRR